MGTISTIAVNASYETLTGDLSYTLVRCEARPFTAGLAPALLALLADTATCADTERTLLLEVERAEMKVFFADEALDGTIDAATNALLTITGGDRTVEPYTLYLKDKTPAELKEPVLKEELETARSWVERFQTSIHPSLNALAPVLAAQVDTADKAQGMLDAASLALTTFREEGPRRVLIETINAKRKATHGALGEIAHSNPLLMLPINFADRFFRHEPRRKKATKKEVQARLDAAQGEVAALEAKLAKMESDEAAEAAKVAAEKEKEKEQKLAAAQKKAAEAAQEIAALQQAP